LVKVFLIRKLLQPVLVVTKYKAQNGRQSTEEYLNYGDESDSMPASLIFLQKFGTEAQCENVPE